MLLIDYNYKTVLIRFHCAITKNYNYRHFLLSGAEIIAQFKDKSCCIYALRYSWFLMIH
ncbi:hypothetical protein ACUY4R_000995 [Kosakonia sp. BK9b]